MKNAIALGLFFAMTASASAKPVSYQLYDDGQNPLCNTISLDQDIGAGMAAGQTSGCGLTYAAGGLYGGQKRIGRHVWTVLTRDAASEQLILILDEKNLRWTSFKQADGVTRFASAGEGNLQPLGAAPLRSARSLASAAAGSADPDQAIVVSYTFAAPDGQPFCDGLTLKQRGHIATGLHSSTAGCDENHYAGGTYGTVKNAGKGVWTIATTGNAFPGGDMIFVIDENAKTYVQYAQIDGSMSFSRVFNGLLQDGAPPACAMRRSGAR